MRALNKSLLLVPMHRQIFAILFMITQTSLFAQQARTVGLLNYDKEKSFDGFNLIFPRGAGSVYLLNNCGEVVHTWIDSTNTGPNQAAYLQPDGTIFIAKAVELGQKLEFDKGSERIEHRDWDNHLLWSYSISDSTCKAHHDFKVMPNGNILVIAWEFKSEKEAIVAGRNPSLIPMKRIVTDQILEIKPIGKNQGKIIWRWQAWQHLIQNRDSTKNNFGVVETHSELIDANYKTYSTKDDWLHINAVDYNQKLDLILLSVPAFNELWIVDHSTTINQAEAHSGGRYHRGGDLLWRWGNPAAYGLGDSTNKKLFFQHNAHWVKNEIASIENHSQSILVFNNFFPDSASSICMITPILKKETFLHNKTSHLFLPDTFNWVYTTPAKGKMFSPVASGVQLLPNGNMLICVGKQGYIFELDKSQRVVWEYVVPTKMGVPVAQGTKLALSDNRIFKMERYPMDFSGFRNKNLSGKRPLELMTDTAFCAGLHYFDLEGKRGGIYVYWNETAKRITLFQLDNTFSNLVVTIRDNAGLIVSSKTINGKIEIKTNDWQQGVYKLFVNQRLIKSFSNY